MSDTIAVYPGSFDPITNGHLDIIERALKIFDLIVIAVGQHPKKPGWLSVHKRMESIQRSLEDVKLHSHIGIRSYNGLTIGICHDVKAVAMIRGLRTVTDFDQEFQIAFANMKIDPGIETVFLLPRPENHFVSSSMVREMWEHGADVTEIVPEAVIKILEQEKPRD